MLRRPATLAAQKERSRPMRRQMRMYWTMAHSISTPTAHTIDKRRPVQPRYPGKQPLATVSGGGYRQAKNPEDPRDGDGARRQQQGRYSAMIHQKTPFRTGQVYDG